MEERPVNNYNMKNTNMNKVFEFYLSKTFRAFYAGSAGPDGAVKRISIGSLLQKRKVG